MSTAGTLYDETIRNGMYTLISAAVVSSPVAEIVFTDLGPDSGYSSFMFDIDTVIPSVALANLAMQVSSDNGATWRTDANYNFYSTFYLYAGGGEPGCAFYGPPQGGNWANQFYIAISGDGNGFSSRVRSLGVGINHRQWSWNSNCYYSGSSNASLWGAGFYGVSVTLNAVRFIIETGTFTAGAIRLYGLNTGALV